MTNDTKIFPDRDRGDLRDGPDFDTPAIDLSRDLRVQTARRDITERRRITQRLRQALASGGLILHYQRQVKLKSGALRGAEAMIRLQHRRRGLILPNRFMPVAEHSDVIHDIGGWALLHACMEAATWPEPLLVAVSLTHRHLQSTRLIKFLIEDNDDIFFSLKALSALGVRVAIDDFGVGYASLSMLKRLPLTTLKLDRSLIHDLDQDNSNSAIIHAAIDAGHALGFSILADGVETEAQFQALLKLGCDEGQGPYLGAPAAAEDLTLRG
jgi:EAL domain-containing protein (putative c-di-GMP-specific phosphodiesterase class I)